MRSSPLSFLPRAWRRLRTPLRRVALLAVSAGLLGPFNATAAESAPGGQPQDAQPEGVLTLEEAVEAAERNSPVVRRAAAERRQVEARRVGASLLLPSNPVVTGEVGRRREQREDRPAATGPAFAARVEQTIEVAGQRQTRLDLVASAVETARAREAAALVETRARVRASYLAARLASEQVTAAVRREALATSLYDAVSVRVAKGAASNIELRQAEVERAGGIRDRLAAERIAAASLVPLRELVGLPAQQPVRLAPALPRPPPTPEALSPLLETARARRIELDIIAKTGRELDRELVRLRREAIPSPTLFVGFQRDLPGESTIAGGLSLPFPIFRRYQGERALVGAAQESLATERVLVERTIANEVVESWNAARGLQAEVKLLESELLPAAEAQVELLTEGWRAGKFELFRVISASREAAMVRRDLLRSLAELWDATVALERATGGL